MNKEIMKIVKKVKDKIDIRCCGTMGEEWKYYVKIKGDSNFTRAMFTPISRYEKERDAQIDCIMYLIIEGIASAKHIKEFDVVSDKNFFECLKYHWYSEINMMEFQEHIELWKETEEYYDIFTQTCALVNLVKTTLTKEDRECIGEYVLKDAFFKEVVEYYRYKLVSYRGLRSCMRAVCKGLGELSKPNLYFNDMIISSEKKNNTVVSSEKEKENSFDCKGDKSKSVNESSLTGYDAYDNYMLSILSGGVIEEPSSETVIEECEDVQDTLENKDVYNKDEFTPVEDAFAENIFSGGYSEEDLIAAEASYLEEQMYLEQYHNQHDFANDCNYDDLFNDENLVNSEDNFEFNDKGDSENKDIELNENVESDSLSLDDNVISEESIKQESVFSDSVLNCDENEESYNQVDIFSLETNNVSSEINDDKNNKNEKSDGKSEISTLKENSDSDNDVSLEVDCIKVNDNVVDKDKYSVVEHVNNDVTYETKILDDIDNVVLFKVTFDIEKLDIVRETINKSLELLQLELVTAVQRQSTFNELTETIMSLNIVLGKLAILKDSHSDSIRLSILEADALLYSLKKIKIYEFNDDNRSKIEYLENLISSQLTLSFERKVEYNEWIKNKSHSSIMRLLFEYK